MKIVRCLHFSPLLLLVGLLVVLGGCGPSQSVSGSPKSDKQDRVQIEIDNQMPGQEKPVVTLAVANQVQQLYTTINALSPMPKEQICTMVGGPIYTLVFLQGEKALATVVADQGGCRPVTVAGERRWSTQDFWLQLDQAIYEATPVASPQQLAVLSTAPSDQPSQTVLIPSASTAQSIYNAALALPLVQVGQACPSNQPEYKLAFHTKDRTIPASIDKACNQITLRGDFHYRGGTYTMNQEFLQLFTKTLAEVVLTPARPDEMLLGISTNTSSAEPTPVADMQLVQKLYDKVFALPATQSPSDDCLGNDKVAGTQKWYNLTFLQWKLEILQITAYEGSCTFVGKGFNRGQQQYWQADQEFWDGIHQAATQ